MLQIYGKVLLRFSSLIIIKILMMPVQMNGGLRVANCVL